jgi:hypothetical protein
MGRRCISDFGDSTSQITMFSQSDTLACGPIIHTPFSRPLPIFTPLCHYNVHRFRALPVIRQPPARSNLLTPPPAPPPYETSSATNIQRPPLGSASRHPPTSPSVERVRFSVPVFQSSIPSDSQPASQTQPFSQEARKPQGLQHRSLQACRLRCFDVLVSYRGRTSAAQPATGRHRSPQAG